LLLIAEFFAHYVYSHIMGYFSSSSLRCS